MGDGLSMYPHHPMLVDMQWLQKQGEMPGNLVTIYCISHMSANDISSHFHCRLTLSAPKKSSG